MKPHPLNPCSSWVFYVLSGADKAERRARLAETPSEVRPCVEVLATYWHAELARARRGEAARQLPRIEVNTDKGWGGKTA